MDAGSSEPAVAEAPRRAKKRVGFIAPLLAAILCTALIVRAIYSALHGRQNGDLMVLVCPLLGATFLSIPAAQAWWACIRFLMKK